MRSISDAIAPCLAPDSGIFISPRLWKMPYPSPGTGSLPRVESLKDKSMIFALPLDSVLSFWGFIFNRRIACSLGTVFLATNLGQFITNLAYYIFLLLLH